MRINIILYFILNEFILFKKIHEGHNCEFLGSQLCPLISFFYHKNAKYL